MAGLLSRWAGPQMGQELQMRPQAPMQMGYPSARLGPMPQYGRMPIPQMPMIQPNVPQQAPPQMPQGAMAKARGLIGGAQQQPGAVPLGNLWDRMF